MLMPAAVLIVVILGALSLDRAIAFGTQRDLVATAQAAANDAASGGIDIDALRSDGEVVLDPERVGTQVAAVATAADGTVQATWAIEGDTVVVHLERQVRYVFTPAVPGGPDGVLVEATARADLRRR